MNLRGEGGKPAPSIVRLSIAMAAMLAVVGYTWGFAKRSATALK